MNVSYDFSGKNAVVTGAAKGIGHSIASKLKGSGANVWGWDISSPEHSDGITYLSVDVSKSDEIDRAISQLLTKTSTIDILVNNAGYLGEPVPVEKLSPEDWRRVFAVNITGVFEVSRKIVPIMKRTGSGRIINMASVAGKEGFPNLSAYSAASAAVIAFTKSLGKELADSGIRVNCVAPAAADTDMIRQFSPEAIDAMIARTAIRRLATPDEVAELVVWLCSDACSFNTAAIFDLSGGRATY